MSGGGAVPDTSTPTSRALLQVLEAAASDLAGTAPLEAALDRIAEHADRALQAPGHLLAVRLPAGGRHLRVRGTGADVAVVFGDGAMAPGVDITSPPGLPVLSVPVASSKHSYGVLAAVAHPGQEFLPEDAEILSAYATLAAVSLDVAEVVAAAREKGETAQLLLDVSRSLAKRSTVGNVARSIAEAVPALSGADRSAVALFDAGTGRLRIAGMSGWHGELAEKLSVYATTAQESPELASLLAHRLPLLVDGNSSDWARGMLACFELTALVAVPIIAENQLTGIVIAHWAEQPPPKTLDGALDDRLTGLASLAAVALDNSRLLEEAQRRALHDPLTGLPNRALLEDRLETALAQAGRHRRQVGVLFCDVNRFKRINDGLGHGAGDKVLRHVAARLAAAVRSSDTVARYSGDEFVILLPGIATPGDAEQVAAKVRENLAEPLEVNDRKVFIDVAIGAAISGGLPPQASAVPAQAARQLIEDADFDMYRAKSRLRGRVPQQRQHRDGLRLESDLRGAAGRGELRICFQPQIDLTTGKIAGAEALVRWEHPELGLLLPLQFIPLAEESSLIGEVGAQVLAEACRAAAGWRAAGHPVELAVNISAAQLGSAGFATVVRSTLEQAKLPAAALTLEITESQVVSDTSLNDNTLHELRCLGLGISVDDFGTGYSSLARLHQLPVTEVKIDRSFTARLAEDRSSAFVAGIVGLGHGLGLRVVAEGVETGGQLEALRAMGCERAQGHLFGEPVEADLFEQKLRTHAHLGRQLVINERRGRGKA